MIKKLMKALTVLLLIMASCMELLSDTIMVPSDYKSIQQAIDASKNNDVILVDSGTYYENIDFKGKLIKLKSANGPQSTIIDGSQNGSVVKFVNQETSDAVIEGFSIINGNGEIGGSYTYGGGVYCYGFSEPSIINNIIEHNISNYGGGLAFVGLSGKNVKPLVKGCKITKNNSIEYGGGIFLINSDTTIDSCIILENVSNCAGGGISLRFACFPLINNNIIQNNKADYGGGIHGTNSACPIIKDNVVKSNKGKYYGGGITVEQGEIVNNLIKENESASGGGISTHYKCEIRNNTIIGNKAKNGGGGGINTSGQTIISNNVICSNKLEKYIGMSVCGAGINITGGVIGSKKIEINNCIICNNTGADWGGGVFIRKYNTMEFNNCTIANNSGEYGGAAYIMHSTNVTFKNSIIYGNLKEEFYCEKEVPKLTYCNIKGGWIGTGNIDADSMFVNPLNNDFHIKYNSPCRDAGDNNVNYIFDFEFDQRNANGVVDIGADEFYSHLYYTDDVEPGKSIEIKCIEKPGSIVWLWASDGMLYYPVYVYGYGDWWLNIPTLFQACLGKTNQQEGVLIQNLDIPKNINIPMNISLQALLGVKLSNYCEMVIE